MSTVTYRLHFAQFAAILLAVLPPGAAALHAAVIIDVAFTGAPVTSKIGFAATGASTNDFWNTYGTNSATILDLKSVDGAPSGAELTVDNAVSSGVNGSSDPMYGTYLFPTDGGSITLTISNLRGGAYDIYLYGHGNEDYKNSDFLLTAGSLEYPVARTIDGPGWRSAVWQEGVQYVEITNVDVYEGATITIQASPGSGEDAQLSGMQISAYGPPFSVPVILSPPADQRVVEGATAIFNATGSGTDPLTYQWLFENAALPNATNGLYVVLDAQLTNAGEYSAVISDRYGSVTSAAASLTVVAAPASLINVAFYSYAVTPKTGLAATGLTTDDFWNTYEMLSGPLTNLKFSDGSASAAALTVSNVVWSGENGASDPMYGTYLFSVAYNDIIVTLNGVRAGSYDLFLYGHGSTDDQNSNFQVNVGSRSYGYAFTTGSSGWLSPVWREGVQYVEFTNVVVGSGETITVTVEPLGNYDAVVSGLQLAAIGDPRGSAAFIYGPPAPQEVFQGAPANFSVAAVGAPPLTYQWFFNDVALAAATNSTYTVNNAQPSDAGGFSVTVANGYGIVTSAAVTLTVDVPPAALIDVAFTGSGVTAKTGFAATGVTTNDYWNTYETSLGALTNLLFVDGTSSGAALTLQAPGAVAYANGAADPMYGTYVAIGEATMVVTVSLLPPGTYDFYIYGHGAPDPAGGFKPDDENSIYQLGVGPRNYGSKATTDGPGWLSPVWQDGSQYVKFTNVSVSAGLDVTIGVSTASSIYSVISGLELASISPPNQSPYILVQPTNLVVFAGADATFGVEAKGAAPLQYQWLVNGAAITGATNNIYRLAGAQLSDAGVYSVTVGNVYGGQTSAVANLNVINPVESLIDVAFTGAARTEKTGFAATGTSPSDFWNTFSVSSGALPNLAYVDGTSSGAGLSVTNVGGAGENGADDAMFGFYLSPPGNGNMIVTITNLPGATYDLFFYGHGPQNSPDSAFELDLSGAGLGIETTTNGSGWLSEVWREGVQYVEFTNITIFPGHTTAITVLPGSYLSGLQMAVVGPPSPFAAIVTQPLNRFVAWSSNATFNVSAAGPSPYWYQWLFDGAAISGATNYSYTVTNVDDSKVGGYGVVVSNTYGSATSVVAELSVMSPVAAIVGEPAGLTVDQGSNATFAVAASGPSPYSYQWLFDNITISSATNSEFIVTNAQRLIETRIIE